MAPGDGPFAHYVRDRFVTESRELRRLTWISSRGGAVGLTARRGGKRHNRRISNLDLDR
jgi:hypothetical protein